MKRVYEFNIGTRYVGSEVVDEMEFDFDDDATEEEMEKEVEEYWLDWRNNNCDGGWRLISEEKEDESDTDGDK